MQCNTLVSAVLRCKLASSWEIRKRRPAQPCETMQLRKWLQVYLLTYCTLPYNKIFWRDINTVKTGRCSTSNTQSATTQVSKNTAKTADEQSVNQLHRDENTATNWSFSSLMISPTTTVCQHASINSPLRSTHDLRLFTLLSLRCRRCQPNDHWTSPAQS